jgi:hypothetical protein
VRFQKKMRHIFLQKTIVFPSSAITRLRVCASPPAVNSPVSVPSRLIE